MVVMYTLILDKHKDFARRRSGMEHPRNRNGVWYQNAGETLAYLPPEAHRDQKGGQLPGGEGFTYNSLNSHHPLSHPHAVECA